MSVQVEVALLAGAFAAVLGFLIVPLWLNRNDLPHGADQNKCKYRPDSPDDPRNIARPDGSIKVIRLTNSGEFVDRCELTNALYELNWDWPIPSGSYGAKRRSGSQSLPKLAILYIHGWKHDASNDDSDLKNFSELVVRLRVRHPQKYVVGIYIGWNATAGLPSVLENISFWVKKSNADRIAQSAVVTKIVSAIGSIIKGDPSRGDQFIAIGHSFGARILFSATAQSLVYQTERAHPRFPGGEYRIVEGAADAVILLNAAFEASRYSSIDDIRRKDEKFKGTQTPLLIAVSTENDWATRRAFPVGQWLGSRRSERELATLGNYEPFFTHTLLRSDRANPINAQALSEEFHAAGLSLTRLRFDESSSVFQAYNPFIVARTTSAVIDGHNGIWAESFMNWLADFITALERSNDLKSSHEGVSRRS
jgi:hypothetical protein